MLLTTVILKIVFLKLQFKCVNSFFYFKSSTIIHTRLLELTPEFVSIEYIYIKKCSLLLFTSILLLEDSSHIPTQP